MKISLNPKVLKWNNAMFHLELDPLDDVAILRYEIFKETQVKPERQKILNLKAKAGESRKLKGVQCVIVIKFQERKLMTQQRSQNWTSK